MIKTLLRSVGVAAFLFALFTPLVFAQNSDLFFGQNHFYTVVFRGNGEAIVYARMIFTNNTEENLKSFSFEIPKVSASELVVFQQNIRGICAIIDYGNPGMACPQYREPGYEDYATGANLGPGMEMMPSYPLWQSEYKKAEFTQSGNLYTVSLPQEIAPNKSSALLVAYAAKGYTSELLGLFSFNFETLKVPNRIQDVQVSIEVDSDLFLKGAEAEVNYGVRSLTDSGMMLSESAAAPEMDRFSQTIGYYGGLTKSAQNLAPNESFTVTGEYSRSWWRLQLVTLLKWLLALIVVTVGSYFLFKKLSKRRFLAKTNHAKENGFTETTQLIFFSLVAGLVSVILLFLATLALNAITNLGLDYSLDGGTGIARVIFALMFFLLYLLFIFGPAVLLSMKFGWKYFLGALTAEFLWLFILLLLYLVLVPGQFFPVGTTYPMGWE